MEKCCSRCKEVKDVKEFYKDKHTKTGYTSTCKKCNNDFISKKIVKSIKYRNQKNYKQITEKKCNGCGKVRDIKYFYKRVVNEDGFDTKCKTCINTRNKKNFEQISLRHKEYNKKNKEQINLQQKKYKEKNKIKLKLKTIEWRNSNAKYKSFYKRLTIDELPRLHEDSESLEVLCKYCGKYFIPKSKAVVHRISALNGYTRGDNYLYCSENCKDSCPIYRQIKYPRGFKKGTSREVDPFIRQLCFKRDNWECQICGKSTGEVKLHCHHIEGYAQNPRLGNDIDNVVTLCKECHKHVHSEVGCRYADLRCV